VAPRPTGRRRTTGSADPTLPIALPAPSALPGRIRPERSVPCSAPFDSPEWRFSVDWDGVRALLFATAEGGIRLQGERLQDLTLLVPEIAAVANALPYRGAVLDGVLAVLDPEGRPDLGALAQRLCGGPRVAPAVFLATDLLHLDAAPTTAWSFDRRLETLRSLVAADAHLQVPDWVRGDGHAFFDAAEERGLSVVLARRAEARYHAGVASPDRLRIAIEERVDAVVVGVEAPPGGHVRLHLGEYLDGRLVPSGRAEATWAEPTANWLRRRVEELEIAEPPYDTQPPLRTDRPVTWLRPHLTLTVRHGGRAGDGTLRFPVPVALREDLEPAACVRRAPVPPPHDMPRPGGFRPTVLSTLPFTEPFTEPRPPQRW
jgi:bifunctional non-homologous end joining protein LigD